MGKIHYISLCTYHTKQLQSKFMLDLHTWVTHLCFSFSSLPVQCHC